MDTNSHRGSNVATHSNTWIGLILFVFGLAAAWLANDFDDQSRSYPFALSIIMASFGFIIFIRVFFKKEKSISFVLPSKVTASAGAIIILWILAITHGFGYLIPTFLMELAFLFVCGFNRSIKAILVAAFISGISYLIFIVSLEVRLPEPLLFWLL